MQIWMSLMRLVSELINRRRNQWVEVSLTRAWSHDTPPKLFDLGDWVAQVLIRRGIRVGRKRRLLNARLRRLMSRLEAEPKPAASQPIAPEDPAALVTETPTP
jgi:hypothetical protein